MLVLGDAHADDPDTRAALAAAYDAADAAVALQVGDLLTYRLPIPTWFVAGNNEDFDVIAALRAGEDPPDVENAHLLASEAVDLQGRRFAGLSGNYAPTRYDEPRSALSGERRRHFVAADLERAAALSDVDVLLTHEAPHGLGVSEDYDVGCTHVDDLLEALEPELCLVGHHHEDVGGSFGPTRVRALAPAWDSYYLLDPADLSLERRSTPDV